MTSDTASTSAITGFYLSRAFQYTRNVVDLAGGIESLQRAVDGTPEDDPSLPARLAALGDAFQTRFGRSEDMADIDQAIAAHRKAVDLTPREHSSLAQRLSALATSFLGRFEHNDDLVDLDHAISAQQQAVDLTHATDVDTLASRLRSLANLKHIRFNSTNDLTDLMQAISAVQRGINCTPADHPTLATLYTQLGSFLHSLFELSGDCADLDAAIAAKRACVDRTPKADGDLPRRLRNLAISLHSRFQQMLDSSSINKALVSQQKALDLATASDTDLPIHLGMLGLYLSAEFKASGNVVSINTSISTLRRAIALAEAGHSNEAGLFANLGNSLRLLYRTTGNIEDIKEAILITQRAVELTPADHPDQIRWLNNLALSHQDRFHYSGDLSDINRAISTMQKAISLSPINDRELPGRLSNLGSAFQSRADRTGDISDVDEATLLHQRAVNLLPRNHRDTPRQLMNLGISFRNRFRRLENMPDIDQAISTQRQALGLASDSHPRLGTWIDHLAQSLSRRFEHNKSISDIDEAVALHEKSISISENHVDYPRRLQNLGKSLSYRYDFSYNLCDISRAISALKRALDVTPAHDASLPDRFEDLGNLYLKRFHLPVYNNDVSDAISAFQSAMHLIPDNHVDGLRLLIRLGYAYSLKSAEDDDMNLAVSSFRQAAIHLTGPPALRLDAARLWGLCYHKDPIRSMDAYQVALDLLSQVAGMDQTVEQRHENLIKISDLATKAAASALSAGRLDFALQWLEQGRSHVWNQLNSLRTSLDDLRSVDHGLADEFIRVSNELERAGSRSEASDDLEPPSGEHNLHNVRLSTSRQEEVVARFKLAHEWDQVLGKVRDIPGFKDFLRPPQVQNLLQGLPNAGRVVIINVHPDRCDALALVSGSTAPHHIPLFNFTYQKATVLRDHLRGYLTTSGARMRGEETRGLRQRPNTQAILQHILRDLWILVVQPILQGLSLTPSNKPGRLWWCVTGPLAFLPIHAAGIYGEGRVDGSILLDYVISSYIPTVSALIERARSSQRIKDMPTGSTLLVSQPAAPNLPPLPGVTKEIRLVKAHLENNVCLDGSAATAECVLKAVEEHGCVHFACHAHQNNKKPLESGFHLHDGDLQLAAIIRKRLPNADLAFLSACQTSAGDERLSEEAVHLGAGMLAVGYRGVVASMWSIQDKYGPQLANDFYARGGRLGSSGAAAALHYATKTLREELGDSDVSFLVWVPYVHFGI